MRYAAADGATLVVLPEKFNQLCDGERMAAEAEPLDGATVRWARELALQLSIDLIAGSFVERIVGRDRAYNTSVHVGPDGEVRAVYRKLHLFDVEVAGTVYRESATEAAGDELVCSTLADGHRVGLSICYDLRFPELYRALVADGARVLCVPAAFTLATTRDHWELLLRARAIENQCFVIAPNQVGEHPPGNRSGGRSMIVDPWGLVLGQVPDDEGTCVCELDFKRLERIREALPALSHRRAELSGWPAGVEV